MPLEALSRSGLQMLGLVGLRPTSRAVFSFLNLPEHLSTSKARGVSHHKHLLLLLSKQHSRVARLRRNNCTQPDQQPADVPCRSTRSQ
jgi:hypothetical protein